MEQEKEAARAAMKKGLKLVTEDVHKKYLELELRIQHEAEVSNSRYEVCSTVIKRKHYDPTNDTFYPVCPEDLSRIALRSGLSTEEQLYLDTVYLKKDSRGCRIWEDQKKFCGTVTMEGEEKEAVFEVRQSERFGAMMEQLYQLFQDNHIPWITVNTGHFDKCYDVFWDITTADGMFRKPESYRIDWGDFEDAVFTDVLPLWNIQRIHIHSLSQMVPCMDGIFYENEFLLEDHQERDGHLIQFSADILGIRCEPEKIVLKTKQNSSLDWEALRISQEKTKRSMDYDAPILTNRKSNFADKKGIFGGNALFLGQDGLDACLGELDIRDYVVLAGHEVKDHTADDRIETGMNWFIRDELVPLKSRKELLLKFKEIRQGHYLNDTMVRFAVSELQLGISEYRCVGVIV